jgi:hypothetical protein
VNLILVLLNPHTVGECLNQASAQRTLRNQGRYAENDFDFFSKL